MNAFQPNCDPPRIYTAKFSSQEGVWYQFKVSTYIDGVEYQSSVMERIGGKCDEEPIPIEPTSGINVSKAFLEAHPNPFNPTTKISFGVPKPMRVELKVFAADGRYLKTLASGEYRRGVYTIDWSATDSRGATMASGIYFVKLKLGGQVLTSKVVLLR